MIQTPSVIPDAHHPPYKLPLTQHEFKLAIQRGQGRIYQHTAQYGLDGMEDAVVHACTNNLRYDTQCEDASQDWLIQVIQAANAQERLFPRILDQIERTLNNASPTDEEVPRYYFAGILFELAKADTPRARELLYKILSDPAPEYQPPPGADEIITLDGIDGLHRVFDQLVGLLKQNQLEQWAVGPCLNHFDRQHNEGEGLKLLSEWSMSNPKLAGLLKYYQADSPPPTTLEESETDQEIEHGFDSYQSLPQFLDRSSRKKDTARFRDTTAEDVIEWVKRSPDENYAVWIRRWARHAQQDAIHSITNEILSTTNPNHVHKYLMAFTKHCPIPFVDTRLLTLVDHPSRKVRWKAYQALATCNDPKIRELALTKRTQKDLSESSLDLFISSYQHGDHTAIEESLFLPDNHHDLHTIGFSLLDIFKIRPAPESLNSMLYVYEHGPCMNCRFQALRIMKDAGVTPDWIAQETQHDADGSIRELITGTEEL